MLELDLKLTAAQVLDECRRHWHLGIPGRPGTLELNEWEDRVWVKVHPLRDGGWATDVAHELSARPE
jgi:hypothetical protein